MPRTLRVPAALAAFAVAGWAATTVAMHGTPSMDGPGAPASFLWLWVAMTAAMMLPSLVPAATLAAAVGRSSVAFVGGYVALWTVAGVGAFEAERAFAGAGKWLAAAALAAAAAYQLTPLKSACLRRCRSPLGSLVRGSAFSAGIEHGALCLGCCWALMLALLAVGAESLLWMAAVSAAIFVEKATTVGSRASAPLAVALLGAAAWVGL